MEDLNVLIRKRGGVKHSLTSFKTYLDKVETADKKLAEQIVIELKERLVKIEGVFLEFCEIQTKVELVCSDTDLSEQYEERSTFEDVYFALISRAKLLIHVNEPEIKTGENADELNLRASAAGSVTDSNSNRSNIRANLVKLPVIQLPKFSGFYENWLEFRDTFKSMIHLNSDLSDIQKLHYLRSSLQGQASQVIRSLEVSDANYEIAWKLICERYDNKKLLVNNHIKALFNLPIIKNESSADMRKLLDELSKHLLALEVLQQPVHEWGMLLIHIVTGKLDNQTKREWEVSRLAEEEDFPTLDDIKSFLKGRCELFETPEFSAKKGGNVTHKHCSKSNESTVSLLTSQAINKCNYCESEDHNIYVCEQFLKLNAHERTTQVKEKKLCLNCLKRNHLSFNCKSNGCKKCNKKHHHLLHFSKNNENISTEKNEEESRETSTSTVVLSNFGESRMSNRVLLSTAIVRVKDNTENFQHCRALLDSGSERCFITEDLCKRLNLPKTKIEFSVMGINETVSQIRFKTKIELKSCDDTYKVNINCFVVNKITENFQTNSFKQMCLNVPNDIRLADFNDTYQSNKIDVLLGANLFWDLLCPNRIRLGPNQPLLQETLLGWVLAGHLVDECKSKNIRCNLISNCEVQEQLKAFWEVEECGPEKILSPEELLCERSFKENTRRDSDNRFIVSLPFKEGRETLGDSLEIATKRFYNLERKLDKNPEVKKEYSSFMCEYEALGHMSKISDLDTKNQEVYYMPHHGVIRETSLTTRLRVVFDASCKTTNGISLNDIQYVGPVIQDNLFNILLRFRVHKYILSADIEKMYRQIWVNDNQRNFQRIVWRENVNEPLQHYCLNTVTYGTASAPYLAIRCLQQLAHEKGDIYPKAASVVLSDFYVDDLLTGTNTIEEAIALYEQITRILESGCFRLRKWMSNDVEILKQINSDLPTNDLIAIGWNGERKTLGLTWEPSLDCLRYSINTNSETVTTKREILSSISRLFDPLGLLGPCIILVKILLQEIWTQNYDWDDPLSNEIKESWQGLKGELQELNNLRIPRNVCLSNYIRIELHTFSDASEVAYGACLYVRIISESNTVSLNLFCAKSKVAPIKKLTIPRLELCAAVLAAKLKHQTVNALKINFNKIYHWCDSTIVLSWLRLQPNRLKVFVSHRVSKIQQLTNTDDWQHISSENNPADLLSRGIRPSVLHKTDWFDGPEWLRAPEGQRPSISLAIQEDIPDIKITTFNITVKEDEIFPFNWTTSFSKLQRITAWCLRFKENCKLPNKNRLKSPLTLDELKRALLCLVRVSQAQTFAKELSLLQKKDKPLKGDLQYLSPFLDKNGLIRVGGRLKNSDFSFDKKHPLVLSGKHPLTNIILQYEHLRLMHAGPQLMLSSVREKFWPTGGRNLARSIVHKCIKCFKVKPKELSQLMGDLPKERVNAKYAFFATGVDYAGPFLVKERLKRGVKSYKCYICLFICLATKAIHLEPVTELTKEAFLATLRRFISRRGRPSHLYSDNATNFVSAVSNLKELNEFLKKNNNKIADEMLTENIQWHFIPPNSPHMGGIWEAGIKSAKAHLKRVLSNALITFEDFLTVLTQIESILNSRPLYPLSTSPDDYEPLTPSHFLIGRSAESLPDPDLMDVPMNRLKRFQYLQRIQQQFWKKWSRDYIAELQQRTKWNKQQPNVNVGDLVLIKDENLPPLKWKLGRVCEIHPGNDNVVRVVSIKTSNKILKRAVAKICVLPIPTTDLETA